MSTRLTISNLQEADGAHLRCTTRRIFTARGFGLGLFLGSAGCGAESQATKDAREFFDPAELPWHPAPGFGPGVWERIVSGGRDAGATTRFVRFDAGSGRDAVVTHDFWEEVYIVSGTFECGGRMYKEGCVAVRPPGMPHGPLRSASGCLLFEVRYRSR